MTPTEAETLLLAACREAVDAIVYDLNDRRGLKWEWTKIDEDIQGEIRAEWAKLIAEELRKLSALDDGRVAKAVAALRTAPQVDSAALDAIDEAIAILMAPKDSSAGSTEAQARDVDASQSVEPGGRPSPSQRPDSPEAEGRDAVASIVEAVKLIDGIMTVSGDPLVASGGYQAKAALARALSRLPNEPRDAAGGYPEDGARRMYEYGFCGAFAKAWDQLDDNARAAFVACHAFVLAEAAATVEAVQCAVDGAPHTPGYLAGHAAGLRRAVNALRGEQSTADQPATDEGDCVPDCTCNDLSDPRCIALRASRKNATDEIAPPEPVPTYCDSCQRKILFGETTTGAKGTFADGERALRVTVKLCPDCDHRTHQPAADAPAPTCPACGANSADGGKVLTCACGYRCAIAYNSKGPVYEQKHRETALHGSGGERQALPSAHACPVCFKEPPLLSITYSNGCEEHEKKIDPQPPPTTNDDIADDVADGMRRGTAEPKWVRPDDLAMHHWEKRDGVNGWTCSKCSRVAPPGPPSTAADCPVPSPRIPPPARPVGPDGQKPSERIEAICQDGIVGLEEAIVQYLDEQHARGGR
jgi:hypothetical protein